MERVRNLGAWRVKIGVRVRRELKDQLPGLARELGLRNQSRLIETLIEQALTNRAILAEQGAEPLGAVRNGG